MRYPIGEFHLPDPQVAAANRDVYVKNIGELPEKVAAVAQQIKDAGKLDVSYREGGWTARQLIHHLADSHINAYVRHRRTLTENHPTLTPYDEVSWAELADITATPIETSLEILKGIHLRWAVLLATCSEDQWQRTAYHSGSGWTYHLDSLAANYSWHGLHHLAHLEIILNKGEKE